ncbi:MAG: hypothetical protein ACKVS9_20175 [Phycisphaerae bacterium]
MRCPKCGKVNSPDQLIRYRYREPGMDDAVAMVSLACGCQIPNEQVPESATDWESSARARRDATLRSIFE